MRRGVRHGDRFLSDAYIGEGPLKLFPTTKLSVRAPDEPVASVMMDLHSPPLVGCSLQELPLDRIYLRR